ncbi:MAG: YkgJ family cysteine cluster protein [Promethearchaeota archaeon]
MDFNFFYRKKEYYEKIELDDFKFKCTLCGKCCKYMGPIPITIWDIINWSENYAIDIFKPYLKIYKQEKISDLVLMPLSFDKSEWNKLSDFEKSLYNIDFDEIKCPIYDLENNKCIAWNYRPLFCRIYPLLYQDKVFKTMDKNCPGLNAENPSEKIINEMVELANIFNQELEVMRVVLNLILDIITPEILENIKREQKKLYSLISTKDLKKFYDILSQAKKKQKEKE